MISARSLGSGSGKGQRRLAVEHLERRSMLAGNVSAFVDGGGNLIVRGDNNDNAVLIQQVDKGEYVVIGLDFDDFASLPDFDFQSGATNISGGVAVDEDVRLFTGVTGNIDVDLKKGDDILAVGNSTEDLDNLALDCLGFAFGSGSGGGSASGSASIAQQVEPTEGRFFVPLNLIVNTGDGNDGVVVNADVRFSAVINTGNGQDGVAFGGPLLENPRSQEGVIAQQIDIEEPQVGEDLVILTGKANDHVCVQGVFIHDHLNIQTADGFDEVSVQEVAVGHMLLTTGNQDDFVGVGFFISEREVVINTGAGNDAVLVEFLAAGLDIEAAAEMEEVRTNAGYITVVTGAGNDEAELFEIFADGLVVDTGAGNDGSPSEESPITVEGAILENHLVVATGAGNDLVRVEDVQAHNVVVDTGAGNDGTLSFPIEIYNVFTETDLVIVTGAGNDVVYIFSGSEEEEPSTIGRNLVVDTGAGNDAAQIVDLVIENNLNVILGAGTDDALIGTSGEIGIQEGNVDVGNNLLVDAGAGNDDVRIGNTEVGLDATLLLGAGNDELDVFDFFVRRNVLINAGAGNDEVSLEFINVGEEENDNTGLIQIFMGAGNDELSIFATNFRRLRAFGGSGFDTLNNDLGVESNGDDGTVEVREFEEFNAVD